MANTTARPGSGVMDPVAAAVSPTATLRESESESGGTAEVCTVSTSGPAANSVSATATPRNRTTNVSGEPGTTAWFARCALATTTTLSGMVSGASRRSFTNATPEMSEASGLPGMDHHGPPGRAVQHGDRAVGREPEDSGRGRVAVTRQDP